jgi:NHL repeat-containing protein
MKTLTLIFLAACTTAFAQTYDTNNDVVQTFAGSAFTGYVDAQGQSAWFSGPSQIVADTSSNLYVWDSGNRVIRKIAPDATVSTLVGGGTDLEGYGTNVSFVNYTAGTMVMDHQNTIWFCVNYVFTYLMTIQTNGLASIQNGSLPSMTTGSGLCFDSSGNLYYSGGNRIYRYVPATGIATVFAGSGNSGSIDGNGISTSFSNPGRMVCDQANNIYVLDGGSLRKIDPSQNVTTITNSIVGTPMAVDNTGNILCVGYNPFIFKFTVKTNVILYAGTSSYSPGTYTNGPGSLARFGTIGGACFSGGSIYVADTGNNRIRQISFNPQAQIVSPANLGIGTYAGVTINGTIGRTYQIQSSTDMNNWNPVAAIILTTSPYLWIDQSGVSQNKFYRALLLP